MVGIWQRINKVVFLGKWLISFNKNEPFNLKLGYKEKNRGTMKYQEEMVYEVNWEKDIGNKERDERRNHKMKTIEKYFEMEKDKIQNTIFPTSKVQIS